MCCVGSSVAAAPTAATPGRRCSMESIYRRPIQWTPTTSPTRLVCWSRARRTGSDVATGATPGCTHPWHLIPHVCPARHNLRRSLLWSATTSFRCSARRGWAGSSLRDNDDVTCRHAGGQFSTSVSSIFVIFGALGRGWRPYAHWYRFSASFSCICGVNRPESASVWMSSMVMSRTKKGKSSQSCYVKKEKRMPAIVISNAGMLSQMRGLELNCGDFELNFGDVRTPS